MRFEVSDAIFIGGDDRRAAGIDDAVEQVFDLVLNHTRADHEQYIVNWLSVLKSDKKAVLTAVSGASEAANWLLSIER